MKPLMPRERLCPFCGKSMVLPRHKCSVCGLEGSGKFLKEHWEIPVEKAYYHDEGTWYQNPKQYPVAFTSPMGYVIFESSKSIAESEYINESLEMIEGGESQINLSGNFTIADIPGFVSPSSIGVKDVKSISTSKDTGIDEILDVILRKKTVILEGVPGTGKTHVFKEIRDKFKHVTFLTFHPSSDYSNFIGGIRPGKDEVTDNLVFNPTKGHLLKIIERANDGKVILWIDELNRANVPRVFGDLISLIGNNDPPELWIPNVGIKETNQKLSLTKKQIKNLHIVGTMNTSDRSVTPLDAALRRRFSFIRLNPMTRSELITLELKNAKYAFSSIDDDLNCFEKINKLMLEKLGSDAILGHSYIIEMSQYPNDDNKRNLMWKYSILPNIIDTLMISRNFDLIGEINSIISNITGLKLVDSAQEGMGLGLGRMILVEEVQE